jgi:hypothetical protein
VDGRAVVAACELEQRLAGRLVVLGDAAVVDHVEVLLVDGDGLVRVERGVRPGSDGERGGRAGRDLGSGSMI